MLQNLKSTFVSAQEFVADGMSAVVACYRVDAADETRRSPQAQLP